jgi:hypothetical protein
MTETTTIMRLSPDTGEDIKQFEKELLGYSETQGRQNAGLNKPGTLDEFKGYILNHVQITVQEMMEKNQTQFLPICGMVIAKQVQEARDKKVQEIRGLINDEGHKLREQEKAKKTATPPVKKKAWQKVAILVVIVMSVLEGVINYGALRNGSFSIPAALAVACALTIALTFTTHILAEFIKHSIGRKQLIIRSSIVLVPAFALFLFLGKLRADGQQTLDTLSYQTGGATVAPPPHTSALAIAFISFFIYALALLISVKYAKSKEEKERQARYDKACRELEEVENRIAALEKEKETVLRETKSKVEIALATYEYALARERHLESIAKKALETYAAINLRHRTDGVCPPFFSTLPECTFTRFFHQTNTQ